MPDSGTDVDLVLFGSAPMHDEHRLRAQLAAVELLIARPDRDVAHHDILIATCLELLTSILGTVYSSSCVEV